MPCGHLEHDSRRSPVTVSPDTPMRGVLRERLSAVPVGQDRGLVGVINRKDLALY